MDDEDLEEMRALRGKIFIGFDLSNIDDLQFKNLFRRLSRSCLQIKLVFVALF